MNIEKRFTAKIDQIDGENFINCRAGYSLKEDDLVVADISIDFQISAVENLKISEIEDAVFKRADQYLKNAAYSL